MRKPTKEEIIVRFLDDPREVVTLLYRNRIESSDEMRELLCGFNNPAIAYHYAFNIDGFASDITRKVACLSPEWAYCYARDVDRAPRRDTREAAYKDIQVGNIYNWQFPPGTSVDTLK